MIFAKHETFYIREGWLFKGMAAIKEAEAQHQAPTIFLDRDAPERLGIGRNMVRALRFWMQATGLAQERTEDRQTVQRLTDFGEWVWLHDRYLEDEATLWLIHYHLVCGKDYATTWYWFFNHFTPVTFEPESCIDALKLWVISNEQERGVSEGSLSKDVTCLIHTYLPNQNRLTPEALTESPLARLKLLSQVNINKKPHYRLERPDSTQLNPLIILYVLLDQQQRQRPNNYQVSLNQVLREPMNVGRVFNLTTTALADLLATLNKQHPDWSVQFVRTAGLDQLTLPRIEANQILARYAHEPNLMREVV